MGRPEGPGCYCFVNSLLRRYLDRAVEDYPFALLDNEAGMEHLSRRTTRDVDLLLIVAEATVVVTAAPAGAPMITRRCDNTQSSNQA